MQFSIALEKYRIKTGHYASEAYDPYGAFTIPRPGDVILRVIADSGLETRWEHVSVSIADRTPSWEEMTFIKNLFWGSEECVMQFHPPKSLYVNFHPYCLHLWKHRDLDQALPDAYLVGPK